MGGGERISNPHALIGARGMSKSQSLSPSELLVSPAARFKAGSPLGVHGEPAGLEAGSPDEVMAFDGVEAKL